MKIAKVWITIVFFLFVLAELYQWLVGFILPLPIYILAGAFLAIASNYDRGIGVLFRQVAGKEEKVSPTATLVESIEALDEAKNDYVLPPRD
ncbi:hypothetical protein NIES593_21650 [Hydrococcus rivularis NIES-593]|uniref:Uncharacterized protein n=1 Tax=Hydrococcus rivularis NIES-593 TaxID=1921803 RepID=A0A1U7H833_9CYAN|nr:hypothetical protein [Hydrococcus rivularis]OKH18846.1 hypothetical protein NIES593_21650 [Hydrococcus rivularis NIES-593]